MKQRLELYIAGKRADIGTESLIRFNYSVEELRNPTIVKNAYSQQLKLKGTPANNAIFQYYFRSDATPSTAFDPSKRVPFEIFTDGGVTVEAGYVKLDSVTQTGVSVEYAVTLYGGLGGFLYSLQYNNDKVKTLADLVYTNSNGTVVDLGFTINRSTVTTAWANISTLTSKWSIVNFAPCYDGIPDNFDAARALIKASKYGLQDTAESGKYTARSGFAVVDLPKEMTGWQVKDLRSYLQRPVISAVGVLRAICNPVNNGGYTVKLDSAFFDAGNSHYMRAWMTLKRLTALKVPVTTESESAGGMTDDVSRTHNYMLGLGNGEKVISIKARPATFKYEQSYVASQVSRLYWASENRSLLNPRVCNGLMLQAVAYDANGNAVAGSRVVGCTSTRNMAQGDTAAEFARNTGFTPVYDDGSGDDLYGALYKGEFDISTPGEAVWNQALADLEIRTTAPVEVVKVYASQVQFTLNGGSANWATVWTDPGDLSMDVAVLEANFESELEYTYTTDANVRSGTEVTAAMLLSDTMSPAEFLLSYCKRFGLSIRVDNDRKVVHIEKRSTTYSSTAVTDLSGRVDRSRAIELKPVPYDAQKFELSEPVLGAGYAVDYKSRYGREYGIKRLNTGFEFNADVKKLLDSTKFKTAPEVLARDLCFLTVTDAGQTPASYPAVFLNSGLKYHLFAGNNRDTNELTVPAVPSTVTYDYYDDDYKTYDDVPRLQLCDGDGKGIDGDSVLVLFQGRKTMPVGYYVSDDDPTMYLGNHENPCWILEARDAYNETGTVLAPGFGRFRYLDSARTSISETVELGMPEEVDIPGVTIASNIDVYALYWARYMSDRYSPRTKVLTCYIYTGGMRFDASSLRKFFWIDGARWTLNKIMDYDLNGDGVCKCEFVQVQDVQNYVNQ